MDYELALREARDTITEQQEVIERLAGAPWAHATVIGENEDGDIKTVVIADGTGIHEVPSPSDLTVDIGDVVRVVGETRQIVSVAGSSAHGTIGVVVKSPVTVHDDTSLAEVEIEGSTRIVHLGDTTPKKDDRVVLDTTGMVIVANLGHEKTRFRFTATTGVSWDDIGGLQDAKAELIEAVELPHRYPDAYTYYHKKPVSGVLLYGPPGCGKTMLGKATATALASIYGKSTGGGFFYIKAPEILNEYVGRSEKTIRQLFERARRFKAEHGHPAVIFIDEADSILGTRGSGISSDMERTIVPTFLTEMDGLDKSGAVVILATNREDVIDPAVLRDGRIDRKVRVSRPDRQSTEEIFNLYLRDIPLYNGDSPSELAGMATAALFDSSHTFYSVPTKPARNFTLASICHGGMIAGIVDQATSLALQRDMSKGSRAKRGLRASDLTDAVDRVFIQNRNLDHRDAVRELLSGQTT